MARYIDADELINYLKDLQKPQDIGFGEESTLVSINLKSLISAVESLPTADVRENVKGEWICCEDDEWIHYECSVCGEIIHHETLNFCPNCGADMRL